MRAARYHGVRDIRVEDVPEPATGAGEVKVKVEWNGICGTDLHEYFVASAFAPVQPHPLTGAQIPTILGHEFAGEVVELGAGVDAVAVGDRVAVEPIVNCGTCPACRAGDYNLCAVIACVGYAWEGGGGLGTYASVRADRVHVLPAEVSTEQGALIEPLSVALHALHRGRLQPGQRAVVHGAGPIGIGLFLALKAKGFEDAIVVEPSTMRRAAIERLGARFVLDPTEQDVVAEIRALTGGEGAAASFDAAGVPASFTAAIRSTGRHGRVVLVAVYERECAFQPNEVLFSECEITSSAAYCGDYPETIALMAQGAYPLDGWVQRIAFEGLIEDGFEALRAQRALKVLVRVGE